MSSQLSSDYLIAQSFADYFEMMNTSSYQESETPDYDPGFGNYSSEWGPNRDPLSIVIPITIMYVVIFVTGVVGNVSTCIVISRNKSMHTATNYYLFSLAVSDLLLLVSGLPPEMYYIWSKYPYVFGEAFCVIQGFAAETSANATVLTITAFTVERYVAICHPFLSHTMSKLSRAIKFVMAIWLLALCLAIPQAMSFGIVYQYSGDGSILENDHYVCAVKRELVPHAFEISTLVFFVAPMSLIIILYVLIAVQLRRSKLVRRGSKGRSIELKHRMPSCSGAHSAVQTMVMTCEGAEPGGTPTPAPSEDGRRNYPRNMHTKATKHVVKMLVAVVVAFFICWAPFHAQRLLAIHGHSIVTPDIIVLYTILTYMSGVLYYLSTCINPFLYNIMSNKFRNAFRETLSRYFQGRNRIPARRYSALSLPRSVSLTRSQSLSHSGGTSRQTSLRFVGGDVSRRPLVVSFRRPTTTKPKSCIHAAHCGCTRSADLRRAIYTNRFEPKIIEETKFDQNNEIISPKLHMKLNKAKKFRKWGRKKRDAHLFDANSSSYKIVCAECHRYMSKEVNTEQENHVVLIDNSLQKVLSDSSCVVSDSFNSSSDTSRDCKCSFKESKKTLDRVPAEYDLIPRHRCPNQFQLDLQDKFKLSNPSIFSNPRYVDRNKNAVTDTVQHSKTMCDIVEYALQTKEGIGNDNYKTHNGLKEPLLTFNGLLILEKPVSRKDVLRQKIMDELGGTRRKWGSADNLFGK